jgi:hypothetical protein
MPFPCIREEEAILAAAGTDHARNVYIIGIL